MGIVPAPILPALPVIKAVFAILKTLSTPLACWVIPIAQANTTLSDLPIR